MGKGYKHGGSGGADPLNFRVKTYPSETELKADKPKENTIGVITTTTMTSWVFSAKEPTEPEVGMVWISVGISSNCEFNALKKNALQVYPLSAKQYVGSKFVDISSYSYQSDGWVDWIPKGLLYRDGFDNEKMTGGIKFVNGSSGYSLGTGTKGEKSITLTVGKEQSIVATTELMDLTEFSKLFVDVSDTTVNDSSNFAILCVSKTNNATTAMDSGNVVAEIKINKTGKVELDISALNGQYCCCIRLWSWNSFTGTASLTYAEWGCE